MTSVSWRNCSQWVQGNFRNTVGWQRMGAGEQLGSRHLNDVCKTWGTITSTMHVWAHTHHIIKHIRNWPIHTLEPSNSVEAENHMESEKLQAVRHNTGYVSLKACSKLASAIKRETINSIEQHCLWRKGSGEGGECHLEIKENNWWNASKEEHTSWRPVLGNEDEEWLDSASHQNRSSVLGWKTWAVSLANKKYKLGILSYIVSLRSYFKKAKQQISANLQSPSLFHG